MAFSAAALLSSLPYIAVVFLGSSLGLWTLASIVGFLDNYRKAKIIGLQAVNLPVYEVNTLYKLTLPLHQPIIEFLGLNRWSYWKYFYMDWHFKTRYDQFRERGEDLILTTSPERNVLTTADADVAYQLVASRNDFPKPSYLYNRANFMGLNVVASEGTTWKRFRKITQPPFNEELMGVVWRAAADLSLSLAKKWTTQDRVDMVMDDIFTFVLAVVSEAGFGVVNRDAFGEAVKKVGGGVPPQDPTQDVYFTSATPPEGYSTSFGTALKTMLMDVILVVALPAWVLVLGPESWKKAGRSFYDTRHYIRAMLHREQQNLTAGGGKALGKRTKTQSILQCVVDPEVVGGDVLSEDDAIGNTFIMALAGTETTADAFCYSMVLLATFPEKQRWLQAEVDKALAGQPDDPREWKYEEVFPKLVAPLCVMNESMRLFPPVPVVPKWAGENSSALQYDGRSIPVPPLTMINISLPGLHQNPKYWGTEAASFRPEIWDASRPAGWTDATSGDAGQPSSDMQMPFRGIRKPVQGSFLPFSDGRRGCLGKKFAQVEFALTLAVLFKDYSVELVREEGETEEDAKKRAWGVMRSSLSLLSLQMQEPVPIRWTKR